MQVLEKFILKYFLSYVKQQSPVALTAARGVAMQADCVGPDKN